MRRTIGSLALASVLIVLPFPASTAQQGDNNATRLVLTRPGEGGPTAAAGAAVAVYLMPYNPPERFTPEEITSGTADESGVFTLTLSDHPAVVTEARKTATRDVNLLVRAVGTGREWTGDWDFSTALRGATVPLHLDLPMEPTDTEGVDDETLLAPGEMIADTPPPGFSCADIGSTQPLPSPPDGSAPWDPYSACEEEAMESGASDGIVVRYVKYIDLHLSRRLSGTVTYAQGRGSQFQVAFRICQPLSGGGCGAFSAGAMRMEEESRAETASVDRDGRHHRTWSFEYEAKRYRRCIESEWQDGANFGRCKKMKRYWVPHRWTLGAHTRRLRRGNHPPMRKRNRASIPAGYTIQTEEHKNKVYGAGVSLFGLSLDSRANYSKITSLSWTGLNGCRNRWIYGRRHPPKEARVIFAKSRRCG